MKNIPLVSVIINCRNGEPYLTETIQSVYQQTFQDWEIVFIDNFSTDNSASIAQSFGDKIKYFKLAEPLTLGAARNVALKKAQGKYIAFLDSDDLWSSEKLSKQVESMETALKFGRNIAACYTDSLRINAEGEALLPYSFERELAEGDIYTSLLRDCFFSCSSCLLIKDIVLSVGGFNPEYKQVEDWDLWLKIAKKHGFLRVDGLLTKIRLHGSNESSKIFEHFDEKILLFKRQQEADDSVVDICHNMIRDLTVKQDLASILLDHNMLINKAGKLLKLLFRHPILLAQLFRKYANKEIFKLFKLKFNRLN